MILVSTWNDFDGAFHRIIHEEESSLLKVSAFWQNNYERWQGAYRMIGGVPELIDKDYKHEIDYRFGQPDLVEEGMLRSPWVDAELSKPGINRLKMLRDIYGMSVCQQTNSFFGRESQVCAKDSCRTPGSQGMLDTTNGAVRIHPTLKSDIRIWNNVPVRDRGPYVMGCDLSHGMESAFSVASVLDKGGEQVLEYGTNCVNITQFAFNCVLLARWLAGQQGDGHVLIDYEANGALAKPFGAELQRMMYGNVHRSNIKFSSVPALGEVPTYMGTVNRDAGLNNFRELERAILSMELVVRSEQIVNDMRLTGKNEDDGKPSFPKGRREGHGDFLHAIGVSWWRSRSLASLENRADLEDCNQRKHAVAVGWEPRQKWSDQWS
jgi:hypothetical protein